MKIPDPLEQPRSWQNSEAIGTDFLITGNKIYNNGTFPGSSGTGIQELGCFAP